MPATTQSTAVPIADKSAARKPLIVAIVTIVLLVGITLLLFFVNVKTAGQAIHFTTAGAGQAGIFLETGASEEVGKLITIPIKANLGAKQSTSFQFAMTLDDHFTYGGLSTTSLMNNLVVNGNDVTVVQDLKCSDSSGANSKGVGGCSKDTKTIAVKMSWFCADDACSNALSGNDVILGEISLVGKNVGVGALTFSKFDVIDLATGNDIISDNGQNQDIEITAPGCSATNLAVCSQVECTIDNKWFWYDNGCYLQEQQQICTDSDVAAANDAIAGVPQSLDQYNYINYKTKGTATGLSLATNAIETHSDECTPAGSIMEYYCDVKNNVLSWHPDSCPSGTLCQDGACVVPTQCVDPDKTYDPDATSDTTIEPASFNTKTTVIGAKSKSAAENPTDSCAASGENAGKLLEVYCVNDKEYFWTPQDCPSGSMCQDGACVTTAVCDPTHLDACKTPTDCVTASGLWNQLQNICQSNAPPVETTGSDCTNLGENKLINGEFNVCTNKGDGDKWWLAINSACTADNQCTKNAACTSGLCKLIDGAVCTGPTGASVGALCASGSCENGICSVSQKCDATHLSLCTTDVQCHSAGLFWNAKNTLSADGWVSACLAACPDTAPADANKNCVTYVGNAPCDKNNPATCTTQVDCNKEGLLWTAATSTCSVCPANTELDQATKACVPLVCGTTHPTLCTTTSSCSTANGVWYTSSGVKTCLAVCPTGTTQTQTTSAGVTYQACQPNAPGAGICGKDNVLKCTSAETCNVAGLLWTAATSSCSACPANTELDQATKACVQSVKKKIQIQLEDASKNIVAQTTKLTAKGKYTVKVTITPEKALPENHLVIVKITDGGVTKTTIVDTKAAIDANGVETMELTHDIAPNFKGDVKVNVYVWKNILSEGVEWEALLEDGSATYSAE